ncbi:hypothetical protein GCM10009843_04660 [Nocardioides bigeumensis]|uniref:Uncharacterized protein n=1 Tax=Nocardioides bigeumensis TaxID=433657 RepID=A0ABN2XPA8_9ACTN
MGAEIPCDYFDGSVGNARLAASRGSLAQLGPEQATHALADAERRLLVTRLHRHPLSGGS